MSVHDVAAYILEKRGPMSAMKLQKLAYYSQAWHLVWHDEPLFTERIEAWANGPVVYELFNAHRGRFTLTDWPEGDAKYLSEDQRESIDAVLEGYGNLTARQLSVLTHEEGPWQDARAGLGPTDRSSVEIALDSLVEFYGALDASEEAAPVVDIVWTGWDLAVATDGPR